MIDHVANRVEFSQSAKLYLIKLLRDVEAALVSFRVVGFDDVAAAVAALAAGTVVLDVEPQGWLRSRISSLWGTLTTRAQGVSAIGGAVTDVVGAIEGVNKMIS